MAAGWVSPHTRESIAFDFKPASSSIRLHCASAAAASVAAVCGVCGVVLRVGGAGVAGGEWVFGAARAGDRAAGAGVVLPPFSADPGICGAAGDGAAGGSGGGDAGVTAQTERGAGVVGGAGDRVGDGGGGVAAADRLSQDACAVDRAGGCDWGDAAGCGGDRDRGADGGDCVSWISVSLPDRGGGADDGGDPDDGGERGLRFGGIRSAAVRR